MCCVHTSALFLHPYQLLLSLRLFFTCLDSLWFPSLFLLFFFLFLLRVFCVLPLPLISPLNLGEGFRRINNFATVRKGHLLSVSINTYCYHCLLSCFFPLGFTLWFFFFNPVRSGTQSLKLVPRPLLSPIPNLFNLQLQAVKSYFFLSLAVTFRCLFLHAPVTQQYLLELLLFPSPFFFFS